MGWIIKVGQFLLLVAQAVKIKEGAVIAYNFVKRQWAKLKG